MITTGNIHISAKLHSIVAVTIVAVLAFLATNVTPAYAYQGDPASITENQNIIKQFLLDLENLPTAPSGINPATGSAYTAAEAEGGLTAAAMEAGALPSLATLGTITLAGATLYTSYKLFSPLGNVIARSIFGDSAVNSGAWTGVTPVWQSICNSGCKASGGSVSGLCGGTNCVQQNACTTCNTATLPRANGTVISAVSDGWQLNCGGASGTLCAGCTAQGIASGAGTHCSLVTANQQNLMAEMLAHLHTGSYIYIENNGAAPGWCGSASVAGDCFAIIRTDSQIKGEVTYEDGGATATHPYGTATTKVDESGKVSVPNTITDDGAKQAEIQCGVFSGTATLTASQEACRAAMNQKVDPSWRPADKSTTTGGSSVVVVNGGDSGSGFIFELPEPYVDDTIDTYIERLRTLGYVGDFTVIDDPMPYPSGSYAARLVPSSITSVQIGTATTIDVYDATTGDRNTWPRTSAATVVTPSTDTSITVGGVPSTYDPLAHGATTSTETGALSAPGATSADCHCPALDFSPIEGITYGSKFPFGVFTWFTDIFSGMAPTGTAISFDLNKTANPSDGTYHIYLGSDEWVSTIRPIVWPIIEFLFVAGAAAMLAYRVLGMGEPE